MENLALDTRGQRSRAQWMTEQFKNLKKAAFKRKLKDSLQLINQMHYDLLKMP